MLRFIFLILLFSSTASPGISTSNESKISFGSSSTLKANATLSGVGSFVVLPNPNVMLANNSSGATFGGITSTSITFGAQNTLLLTADATIASADQAWLFPQSATIDGQGHTLTINKNQAIQVSSTATLTIKNCTIVCAGRDAIGCTSDTAKIIFDGSTIVLGLEGLGWKKGSIDIQGQVQVLGYSKPFFADPSGAELVLRANDIGFGAISGFAGSSLYTLDFCGPHWDRSGVSIARVDKAGTAYFSDSLTPDTPSWTAIPGGAVYKCVSIGTDGTIWVVGTNNTIYRYRCHKDTNISLTATSGFTGTPAQISVGNRYYVFARNTVGAVYRCTDPDRGFLDNPLTGAPAAWTLISNVNARNIAAGTDGCFWYINQTGQVFMQDSSGNDTLLHDGAGYNFVKVSAKGSSTRYSIALTCSATNRVVVSYDGCPFKDLGLSNIQEACTDVDGNILLIFQNSKITEDATFGAPLYYRHAFAELPIFALDKTLTFSASAGANLTIKSGATLAMGQDTTLRMNSDNAYSESGYNARRHLVMADQSSNLILDRASIESVCEGLTLTTGNLIINGTSSIKPSSWDSCYTEISSDVNLKILAGGNLQTYGRVDYCAPGRLMQPITGTTTFGQTIQMDYQTTAPNFYFQSGIKRGLYPLFQWNSDNSIYYNSGSNNIRYVSVIRWGGSGGTGTFTGEALSDYNYHYTYLTSIDKGVINLPNLQTTSSAINFFYRNESASSCKIRDDGQIVYMAPGFNILYYMLESNNGPYGGGIGQNGYVSNPGSILSVFLGGGREFYLYNDNTLREGLGGTQRLTGVNQRCVAVTTDCLWFIDSYGVLKYYKHTDPSTYYSFKAPRNLNLVRVDVAGSLTGYKILALASDGKVYSADTSRGLEFENFYTQAYLPKMTGGWQNTDSPITVASNGVFIARGSTGYLKGLTPSSWVNNYYFESYGKRKCLPKANNVFGNQGTLGTARTTLGQSQATKKGFRRFSTIITDGSYSICILSGYTSGSADRLYVTLDGLSTTEYGLNPADQTQQANTTTIFSVARGISQICIGTDKTTLLSHDGVTGFTGAPTTTDIITTGSSPRIFACANASNIFRVDLDTCNIYKWVSGTTWGSALSIYPYRSPISIAASTDGGLWFIETNGNLKFRSSGGTISDFPGGSGLNLIRVHATGSSTSFKLVAIDNNGNLYSADQQRSLELEGICNVEQAAVSSTGLCAIAFKNYEVWIGWIKNCMPKSWPYKITG